jgi:hypothetical protein
MVNSFRPLAVAEISASFVVALTPDDDETRTRPWESIAKETRVSVKLSFIVDSGNTSTLPSFPKLTTALDLAAVVTVLSENTGAPEVAEVPLTLTSPSTLLSFAFAGVVCSGLPNATRQVATINKMRQVRLVFILLSPYSVGFHALGFQL